MESVGTQLREARRCRGLTLEQINAKTRISLKNLRALEDDDLLHISSPFFYRSFVRQVAEHLQLDYGGLAEAVQEAASKIPEPLMPGQVAPGHVQAPPVLKMEGLPQQRRPLNLRWLYSLSAFTVMLVGCSSVYGLWQQSRSNWRASLAAAVSFLTPPTHAAATQPARDTAPQAVAANPPANEDKPAALATQSASSAPVTEDGDGSGASAATGDADVSQHDTSPSDAAFRVELSAIERTWLSIVADGKETFTGILEAAETKVLEGRENARIRTGNAGGLSLVFNGKPIGTIGPHGQIRTVVFTKDNYEVLEAGPHIAMTHFNPNVE